MGLDIQVIQDDKNVIQISFAGSSSNYTPCFSVDEFKFLKYCIKDLPNHMGELEYCPKLAMLDPDEEKSGVLTSLQVDNEEYELQFHDGRVWAQIQLTKKQWHDFERKVNNFEILGE